QLAGCRAKALVLLELLHELAARVFGLLRLALGWWQQQARLDLHERRRHHQILARQVEVQLLEEAKVGEILVCDQRDRNVVNVDLVLLDQVQQEIERPFEDVELKARIHTSPTASRTSRIVSLATACARRLPSSSTSVTSDGLVSISRRRSWIGFRSSSTWRIMIFLHSRHPMEALLQPLST